MPAVAAPPSLFAAIEPAARAPREPVYSRAYLESIQPPNNPPRRWTERLAHLTVIAASFMTYCLAVANPLWVLDSPQLNWAAARAHPTDVEWARRFLLNEALVGVFGLAAGLIRHWRSVATNTCDRRVAVLLAEFHSHRMHLLTWQQVFHPGVPMRFLLVSIQVALLPLLMGLYLAAPGWVHQLAQYAAELNVRLYTLALYELDQAQLPRLAKAPCPDAARQHYGLQANARARDALLCIRADELYHARFNRQTALKPEEPFDSL